ncbi:hypothetical protein Goari_006349 [Gossypium aridum]|uniref:RNase H type-1 domain-containing protein n=1 Tax=Gossypium aridum TaxID=34290 RepID=A0A7J8XMS8_GOSAI|nr:hypothetical protein [Gossypium aridum]
MGLHQSTVDCKPSVNFYIMRIVGRVKWEKPPIGFMKVNMDAVVCNNKYGFRVIIRDCDGFVCSGCAGYKGDLPSTELVEIDALVEGISMARSFNFDHVIFEFDCASIVNHLRKYHVDITILGHRIVEIRGMIDLFAEAEVRWISHDKNKVVDKLCSMAMINSCNLSFELEYPSDIHQLVILDSFSLR